MRSGKPEPFAANVVNVGKDVGNSTPIFTGRFSAPRPRVEMLQQELVHLVIYQKCLCDFLRKIGTGHARARRHGTFSDERRARSTFLYPLPDIWALKSELELAICARWSCMICYARP